MILHSQVYIDATAEPSISIFERFHPSKGQIMTPIAQPVAEYPLFKATYQVQIKLTALIHWPTWLCIRRTVRKNFFEQIAEQKMRLVLVSVSSFRRTICCQCTKQCV